MWGLAGVSGYILGNRMAPNGLPFDPLFSLDLDINVGLLPKKQLYLFLNNKFWAQKATAGVTNPSQGNFDFSKREYDIDLGLAWNYFDRLELRASAYGLNNLNRGTSPNTPTGFRDGTILENRYYFGSADIYDLGRLSFVSLGYYPTQFSELEGQNGEVFHPGLFLRGYVTADLPLSWPPSYVYADVEMTAQRAVEPRLIEGDGGLALRPFHELQNLEFRLGDDITHDLRARKTRNLVYAGVRVQF